MEQKFVSFSLDQMINGNHDSKLITRDSTLSVNQIVPRMAKSPPWSNHYSVCSRFKFSSFSIVEHTDFISYSSSNPMAHRMNKTQLQNPIAHRMTKSHYPNPIAHRMTKSQYPNPIAHRMTKTLSFGHSVGNRVYEILNFGHSVGNRVTLLSFSHSVGNRVNATQSFGHSVGNGVKEIYICACPLCWNKLAIMTCGCDYNLKVFHDRWFCYNFGLTMELYLFLVSKLWL